MLRRMSLASLVAVSATLAGCDGDLAGDPVPAAPPAVAIAAATAVERPIPRFLAVTGTLAAEEAAEVAAEVQGRVVATPVERGTRVGPGDALIRIAAAEMEAQVAEAEANAAQIEQRLALHEGAFDVDRVPEVANARANLDLATSDFDRAQMLYERQLLSKAEFDQRRAQAEVSRRQYDIARNGAGQQYQALLAARARVTLAKKALDDTVVRAPFAGVVGERLVSVGDFVTRGTKVASVMRTNPLRVNLTVPEQYSAAVAVGRAVSLQVDAAPGRQFSGRVRYVSPALKSESRTLLVEAVVANDDGALKPGAFATARIEQATETPAVLVPPAAVRTVAGTARVFVVTGDHVDERIVTLGQTAGDLVEIAAGLKGGERVATSGVDTLVDGMIVEDGK